jgi:tetratricopeptide (TPR) repeat protein
MLFGLLLFPLLCAIVALAPAQIAKRPSPSRPLVSDSASRNQLAAYLADFQKHPDDLTLRKEIVELAATLNPAPAISPLARDSFARATARMKIASSADDFKAAARLFEQAAVQAPWYADADYSAATACAKAADYDGARRNMAFYQAAVRPGVDPNLAEDLRSDIDSQQAAQQFQQALGQFAANPTSGARLQIIKIAQAMKTPPEIPEDARGHYVMASVLANSVEDNPTYAKRAVDEYNAALLTAPWWGDVYKKPRLPGKSHAFVSQPA